MQYLLIQRIFEKAIEFHKRGEFQIYNALTTEFRPYIYDEQGNYLIGGKQINDFIHESVTMIEKYTRK